MRSEIIVGVSGQPVHIAALDSSFCTRVVCATLVNVSPILSFASWSPLTNVELGEIGLFQLN